MKLILSIFCLGFCIGLNAQYSFKDSFNLVFYYDHVVPQNFQFIANPNNKKAVGKINEDIYNKLYAGVFPIDTTDTLGMHGTFQVTGSEIGFQSKKVLAFTIEVWFCGMACYGGTGHYNYESKTGDKIILDSLFTIDGMKLLDSFLLSYRNEIIKDRINEFMDSSSLKELFDNDTSFRASIIDQYNNDCMKSLFYKDEFQIDSGRITFYPGNCLSKALHNLDFFLEIPIKVVDWKKYLTPYGKRILF